MIDRLIRLVLVYSVCIVFALNVFFEYACGPKNYFVPPLPFQSRGSTIATIVVHAVALLAFGWVSWSVWLASLISFIMGGILLCQFNKCTYIVAGSLFILGCIFDLVAMAWW